MTQLYSEREGTILGVPVKFSHVRESGGLVVHQTAKTGLRPCGEGERARVTLRFDDSCGNGKMSFGITCDVYDERGRNVGGGADRELIARAFPELKPLLLFHLFDTAGPFHYPANAVYHASDRDHHGLRAGETKPLRNGRTGQLVWKLVTRDQYGAELTPAARGMVDSDEKPAAAYCVDWEQVLITGEGKARDLAAARSCAAWPDAPDSTLELDRDELTAALLARLPVLVARFRSAMQGDCGFVWLEKGAAS